MASKSITLELLPEEREVLLKWSLIPEVRSQLEAIASSEHVEAIQATPTDIHWLAGDLNHAIVKKGCRDQVAIELAERLEYVEESRNGRLESWYW
jgi:hypothetical protein